MKPTTIFIIIIIAVITYSVFDQYFKKENLQLQENKPLTATASQAIKQKPSPNPNNPNPEKEETIKETSTQETTDISPYYGKVKLSTIRAKTSYRPSLITLSVRVYSGEKINMTGWKIKARKGEIIIKENTKIYLINDSNPLGRNKNFCLNKCFGYIKNYNSFYPSFYAYCPKPKLEDVSHLNPYCQEYILRLSSCEIPNYSNNIKIATDSKCVSFLNNTFNYSSCFKQYSQDEDFLKNYWYVYVGTDIVEPLHDTIYLLDPNGLLVDKYMY